MIRVVGDGVTLNDPVKNDRNDIVGTAKGLARGEGFGF